MRWTDARHDTPAFAHRTQALNGRCPYTMHAWAELGVERVNHLTHALGEGLYAFSERPSSDLKAQHSTRFSRRQSPEELPVEMVRVAHSLIHQAGPDTERLRQIGHDLTACHEALRPVLDQERSASLGVKLASEASRCLEQRHAVSAGRPTKRHREPRDARADDPDVPHARQ